MTVTETIAQPPPLAEPDPTQPLGSVANPAILDPLEPGFMGAAHALYADLRERGAVVRARFRSLAEGDDPLTEDEQEAIARSPFVPDLWLVVAYEEAVQTLLDERLSADPLKALTPEQRVALPPPPPEVAPLSRSLLTLDPPDHTRLRKLVQPWFTGRAMDALKPRIAEIAEELLDDAERAAADRGETAPNRTMDLVDAYAYPLPMAVICEMLGVPAADRAQVRRWTEDLLSRRGRTLSEEQRADLRAFSDYLRGLADARRADPADDLISFLVAAEEEGDRLDETELLSMLFLLIVAGHITTVNLIGSGVFALLTRPEQMAAVRAEPMLTRNLVEETLRYWGPAENTVPRVALEEIEVGGVRVATGERVAVNLAGADRDPAKFGDPDTFDVRRPDANRHIAFGKGIHVCLGAPLARAEGEIAFARLLRRYPDLRLAVPAGEVVWRSNFLRGLRALPVRF